MQSVRESKGISQQYNFTMSDNQLREQCNSLKLKIVQFVDKYTGSLSITTAKHLNGTRPSLSDNIVDLVQHPMLRPFAAEAYIWHILEMLVFSPSSCVWAGLAGKKLDGVSKKLAVCHLYLRCLVVTRV